MTADAWWNGHLSGQGTGSSPVAGPSSAWSVAIDFGTTATAAAIVRGDDVELVRFSSSTRMPSGVFVDPTDGLLCASTALNRGGADPGRYVRTPKRHVGRDETVVVGGSSVPVVTLVSRVLAAAVAGATDQAGGGAPDRVVLTHPARWGADARAVLVDAASEAGVDRSRVALVPEPVAAGHDASSLVAGSAVAVYDLGGGTFDAVVMVREDRGSWMIAGPPGGIDPLGGESIDALLHRDLVARVRELDGTAARVIDSPASAAERGFRRTWWRDLRAIKEELSDATSGVIAVPGTEHSILVSRSELEDLVAPSVASSVEELERTIRSSSVTVDQLSEVLLCGDASRMPIVARLVSEAFPDVTIRAASDPKGVVALGAVSAVAAGSTARTAQIPVDAAVSVAPTTGIEPHVRQSEDRPAPRIPTGAQPSTSTPKVDPVGPPPQGPPRQGPPPGSAPQGPPSERWVPPVVQKGASQTRTRRTGVVVASVVGVLALLAVGVVAAVAIAASSGGGNDDPPGGDGGGESASAIETQYAHFTSSGCDMDSSGLTSTCTDYGPSDIFGVTATFTDHEGSATSMDEEITAERGRLESDGTLLWDADYHDGTDPGGSAMGAVVGGYEEGSSGTEYSMLVTDDLSGTSMLLTGDNADYVERVATDQIESTLVPTAEETFGSISDLTRYVGCWPNLDMFLVDTRTPVSYDCWTTTMGATAPEIQARFLMYSTDTTAEAELEAIKADYTVSDQGEWTQEDVTMGNFVSIDYPVSADGYSASKLWTYSSEPQLLAELVGTDHRSLDYFWSNSA